MGEVHPGDRQQPVRIADSGALTAARRPVRARAGLFVHDPFDQGDAAGLIEQKP